MGELPNPTLDRTGERWARLKRTLENFKLQDPPTEPQLAIPITVVHRILRQSWRHPHSTRTALKHQAIADLINIAFYYLLRVGEYTKPRSQDPKLTIPFAVKHVTFWTRAGRKIPSTSSFAQLCTAARATIKIPRSKNGMKGQAITQDCTGTDFSPVRSLARRVHQIMSHGGTPDTPIYSVRSNLHTTWQLVTSAQINTTLKQAARDEGLPAFGFTDSDISSHSLRAGGAMALHLNGFSPLQIKKMGRWKSEQSFECYIHDQLSAFSAGMSVKMSRDIPYQNLAAPTLTEPDR